MIPGAFVGLHARIVQESRPGRSGLASRTCGSRASSVSRRLKARKEKGGPVSGPALASSSSDHNQAALSGAAFLDLVSE